MHLAPNTVQIATDLLFQRFTPQYPRFRPSNLPSISAGRQRPFYFRQRLPIESCEIHSTHKNHGPAASETEVPELHRLSLFGTYILHRAAHTILSPFSLNDLSAHQGNPGAIRIAGFSIHCKCSNPFPLSAISAGLSENPAKRQKMNPFCRKQHHPARQNLLTC